ncbi:MAG TPA: TolC family protein [Smithellaceae bacterium]|nr:TolC family protein [Smithellaceae bacterium]HRV45597.1 TolC family protein [Smithellaceae bacterium]
MLKFIIKNVLFPAALTACALALQGAGNIVAAAENHPAPAAISGAKAVETESGGLFTLQRCIEIALDRNPEIAASKWDIAAADARYDGAKSAFWPQFSIEGGYQRSLDDQRLIAARYNGEPGVFDRDLVRGDVMARVNLFAGGRMISEADAARKLSAAEKKKFIRTRDELIYAVTGVYFSVLGQQKILESLKFSHHALDLNRQRVAKLYEAQKVAKVDLLRTEVRLSDVNQSILKEENTLAIQKRLLFNLMGYDAVPENARLEDKASLPAETALDMGRLIETALKNRPDFQAAKDRVAAQTARVYAARAGHLPSINLVGTYGVRYAPRPDDVGKYPGTKEDALSTEDVGSIGIFLSVPLFEGGRVSAKVREEAALLAAAQDRLKKLELQIRQETEAAALDVLSNTARFKATEKSIEQAKESLRIESMKYELGKGSITDLLDAQAALLQAETGNCRTCIDFHISIARLKLATGGE